MATWTTEEETKLEKVLKDAGACSQCTQRFLGYRHNLVYRNIHEKESELTGAEPASKQSKPNPCVVCLGILQHVYMMPRMEDIVRQIKDSGYDAERFTLSLSLPISLTIREHALWLHLEKELKESVMGDRHRQTDIVPLKQVWKYIYPQVVESRVGLLHESGNTADFYVEVVVLWDQDETEMSVMSSVCPREYKTRAKQVNVFNMGVYSRQGVEKSLEGVSFSAFAAHSPVPPAIPDHPFTIDFRMTRNSIFVGGRYCKYSRHLPQTPWLIKGVRKCETSVEELIAVKLKEYLGCEETKFLASGREDVDVRMLGTGRPFAFECVNSKKTRLSADDLDALMLAINKNHEAVQVNSMALVTKQCIKRLKEGEDQKRKRYTALCRTEKLYNPETLDQLDNIKELMLQQDTPVRVLHRRSNATRERLIHEMKVEPISANLFKLSVISGAGAYIKELVHGDFGRTSPSLRTILGLETDILALDVEEVYLDWPNVKT